MARRPNIRRVVRRAWVLSCVTARGFIEGKDDPIGREATRGQIVEWFDSRSLRREAERDELAFLETEVGRPARRQVIDSTWRSEGIAVLAWALGLWTIGPFDQQLADARGVVGSLGYMDDVRAERLLQTATLRPLAEIKAYAEHILNVHWRLQRVRRVKHYDCRNLFREELEEPTPGTTPIELVGGDLTIAGVALAKVDDERLNSALNVVRERQRAANWLQGDDRIYSEVALDT
jgi:hypothetical protein